MVRSLAVVLFAVASSVAQTTHVVGAGGTFAQIRDAAAVAVAGDIIAVLPGNYAQFTLSVGATIRAIVPGTVSIVASTAFVPAGCGAIPACAANAAVTSFAVPANETAHVVGLQFDGARVLLPPFIYPRVEVTSGRVTFDQCQFASLGPHALRIDQARVHLQQCTATCGGQLAASPAITATGSVVTVVGGSFTGSTIGFGTNASGDGIRLSNCQFQGSGFTAIGGLSLTQQGGNGLTALGGTTWISDATLQAGSLACALSASGGCRAERVTYIGTPCAVTSPGVLGVLRPAPLQVGTTFTLDFRTNANGFVAVFASPQLATNAITELAPAPHLWLPGVLDGGLAFAGATGVATVAYAVPNVPQLVAQQFWFQGVTGLSFPLQTSSVAGGIVR